MKVIGSLKFVNAKFYFTYMRENEIEWSAFPLNLDSGDEFELRGEDVTGTSGREAASQRLGHEGGDEAESEEAQHQLDNAHQQRHRSRHFADIRQMGKGKMTVIKFTSTTSLTAGKWEDDYAYI